MPHNISESQLARILAALPERVVAAYLFGSEARGEASPKSDVDLGVLLREAPPATLAGRELTLAGDLASALGGAVDLVILNDSPVDLAARVLRDGRLLLDRDRSTRIRFEVDTRNRYFDLLPHLRRYRAAALARSSAAAPSAASAATAAPSDDR